MAHAVVTLLIGSGLVLAMVALLLAPIGRPRSEAAPRRPLRPGAQPTRPVPTLDDLSAHGRRWLQIEAELALIGNNEGSLSVDVSHRAARLEAERTRIEELIDESYRHLAR